jgi:hypothetical protein
MSQPPKRRYAPRRDDLPTGPVNMRFICKCGADVTRYGCDPLEARLCLNCIYGKPAVMIMADTGPN